MNMLNSLRKALKQGRTNASERACLPLSNKGPAMSALSPIPVRQSMRPLPPTPADHRCYVDLETRL
ncbi:hypothetical protein EMIT0P44_250066 [Pseudomonas sp. IT-P44]